MSKTPPIIFFSDGFDWKFKGNRYYYPLYWAKKTKILVVVPFLCFKDSIKFIINKKPILEKKQKNFYIFRPLILIPLVKRISVLNKLANFIVKNWLKLILIKLNISKPSLWFFYPEAFWLFKDLQSKQKIYHLVDFYWNYPFYYKSIKDKFRAKALSIKTAQKADMVFCSSQEIYKYIHSQVKSKNIFLLENGSNTKYIHTQMSKINKEPIKLKKIKKPRICFIGNMENYRFNLNLLEFLVKNLSQQSFILIGKDNHENSISKLSQKYKNCFYLGSKLFVKLIVYLKFCDVFIIPYKINVYTKGVLPIKLFEYLATGKPIVTSDLLNLKKYQDLIYIAKNKKQFLSILKQLVKGRVESNTIKKQRIKTALKHDWSKLIEKSEQIIKTKLSQI
jgi:glycosyltransferase involved in cell wall biosynthesis